MAPSDWITWAVTGFQSIAVNHIRFGPLCPIRVGFIGQVLRRFQNRAPSNLVCPTTLLAKAVWIWNSPSGIIGTVSNALAWIASLNALREAASGADTHWWIICSITS